MGSSKGICVGCACLLASSITWADVTYTGGVGGTFDSASNGGTFIDVLVIANLPTTAYDVNFLLNYRWNVSATSATAVTPGNNIGGVYDSGAALIPNFIVNSGTSTTRWSLVLTYGGLDQKGQLTFDLKNAVALNYAGSLNSAVCGLPVPTTPGETWTATYQIVNGNGQTGTRQMTWVNQGPATFNNQSATAVQETTADSSGTSTRTNYYSVTPTGLVLFGMATPASPTLPATQKIFSPPYTSFPLNLPTGSSNFYYTMETTTSGSSVSTAARISTLTFAGVQIITTPAGPVNACVFRYTGAVGGQPKSITDMFFDSQTGGLVRTDVNGATVQLALQYKF